MAMEKREAHNRKQPGKTLENALEIRAVSPGSASPVSVSRPSSELGAPLAPSAAAYLATGSSALQYQLTSLMHGDGLKQYEGRPFPVGVIHENEARGEVELRPSHYDGFYLPAEEMEYFARLMFEQAGKLSQVEADILDVLSDAWIEKAKSPNDWITIDIDEIATRLGHTKKMGGSGRRGGIQQKTRLELARAAIRLSQLWLNMESLAFYEDSKKKGKKDRRQEVPGKIGPAFHIEFDYLRQVSLDGAYHADNIVFTAFRYHPGSPLKLYLWGDAQRAGRQTSLINTKVLQLNPYTQEPEKRLGRYFSYLWKVRAHNASYSDPLRVSTLLEKATITVNEKRPGEARARLEKALDTLREEGIITAWRYVSWAEADAPARGWLPGWLSSLIVVEAPQEVKSHYIENLSGALPELTEETPLKERLRATRTRLELSQEQAAEDAGLSQQTYSRAERGSSPSAPTLKKLEAWLKRHK